MITIVVAGLIGAIIIAGAKPRLQPVPVRVRADDVRARARRR